MLFLVLSTVAAVASARPSFIAVPADQIAFVDLASLHIRRPRQAPVPLPQPSYPQEYPIPVIQHPVRLHYQQQPYQQQVYQPIPIDTLSPPPEPLPARTVQYQQEPIEAAPLRASEAQLSERPADFGEYVDFGAHTGDNGAFGWYADFPVNNHDESDFRK